MAANMTDSDHFVRLTRDPTARQRFSEDADGMNDLYAFTRDTVHDVYAAVDLAEQPEMLGQEGKVVLVTGAGRGIGREIATTFARAKAKAVVICARTVSQLEETEVEIRKANSDVQILSQQVDVSSEMEVKFLFDAAVAKFGTIDVVVSNAGSNRGKTKIADANVDTWWRDVEINLKGLFLVSKYFILSLDGRTGTLTSISSTTGLAVIPTQSAYGIKYPNVRSFSLHPGMVDTEMTKYHNVAGRSAWTMDSAALAAGTVLYLTTPRADYLRGRYIGANWRMDELEQKKETIAGENLLKTGISGKLGAGGHKFG